MAQENERGEPQGPDHSPRAPGTLAELTGELRGMADDIKGVAHDQARLALLELKRAAHSLVLIIALGLIAGAISFSTWLMVNWVAISAMRERDLLTMNSALLIAIAANMFVVLLLIGAIRHASHGLLFPATLDSLVSSTTLNTDGSSDDQTSE